MSALIIVYDDSCPLCAGYTNAFIKTGLLDKEGRKHFSQISPELIELIDVQRAVNEIPLINPISKQVWYGIDALLEILQQKIPFAKTIGNLWLVKWMLLKTYKLVSYNRRVIVATSNNPGTFNCTPDFNIFYRLVFMAILLCLNTLLIFPFHRYITANSIFHSTTVLQLQWAHAILVLSNFLLATGLRKKEAFEYLGQINMLAIITLLLSLPLVIINQHTSTHNATLNSFFLGMLAFFATTEYFRRMRYIRFTILHRGIVAANIYCLIAFFIYLIASPN